MADAVQVLLDGENLFRAFGYETEDERKKRTGQDPDEKGISKWRSNRDKDRHVLGLIFGDCDPIHARSEVSKVLGSLLTWASTQWDINLSDLAPRVMYGKHGWDDSAMQRLESSGALTEHGFTTEYVPQGKDLADEAIMQRMAIEWDEFGRWETPMVIGTEDHDNWTYLLDLLDRRKKDPNGVVLAIVIPPHAKLKIHERLYETSYWPNREKRVVTPAQEKRRRSAIRHGYLHEIHHHHNMSMKTQHVTPPGPGAQPSIGNHPRHDLNSLLRAVAAIPQPSAPSNQFGSQPWVARAVEHLEPALGMQDALNVLDELADMARWFRKNPAAISSLVPETWADFAFVAIFAPSRIPNWPLPQDQAEILWDRMAKFRRDYFQQHPPGPG